MNTGSKADHSSVILHHFPASPFAEKIRLVLGFKQLSWYSVDIPMVMPKPKLTALTGGYRKTPVLQIGADIYCDTQRIARELDARFSSPALFADHSETLSMALSAWSDILFFRPGAALSMGTNPDIPDVVLDDRRAFFSFLDFDSLDRRLPHFYSQFQGHLYRVNKMLEERGPFLLGEQMGWSDILAYFPLWMGRGNIRETEQMLAPLRRLLEWEERLKRVGHGSAETISADAALEIAAGSESLAEGFIAPDAWPRGLREGDKVSVRSEDYGAEAVEGSLLRLTNDEIAIRRDDAGIGSVVVHFPRLGYELIQA